MNPAEGIILGITIGVILLLCAAFVADFLDQRDDDEMQYTHSGTITIDVNPIETEWRK